MEKKSEYTFTEPQLAHILALQQQGASLSEIAEEYQVSGQVICEEIKRARHFNEIPDVAMRIYFMNREELCTAIDIDFRQTGRTLNIFWKSDVFRKHGITRKRF